MRERGTTVSVQKKESQRSLPLRHGKRALSLSLRETERGQRERQISLSHGKKERSLAFSERGRGSALSPFQRDREISSSLSERKKRCLSERKRVTERLRERESSDPLFEGEEKGFLPWERKRALSSLLIKSPQTSSDPLLKKLICACKTHAPQQATLHFYHYQQIEQHLEHRGHHSP